MSKTSCTINSCRSNESEQDHKLPSGTGQSESDADDRSPAARAHTPKSSLSALETGEKRDGQQESAAKTVAASTTVVTYEQQQQLQSTSRATTISSKVNLPSSSFNGYNQQNNNQPQQPAPTSLAAPHFFLSHPAGNLGQSSPIWSALNGTTATAGHFLPPFGPHGASQFASLTPDARACVTATYLCVLIVNNTWLDCNLLDTLCNGNNSSNSNGAHGRANSHKPYSTSEDEHQQQQQRGHHRSDGFDSSLRRSRNISNLFEGKRDEFLAESALESTLTGLITLANGGHAEGNYDEDHSALSSEDHHLSAQSQLAPMTAIQDEVQTDAGKRRIYLFPLDLAHSPGPDKEELRAQLVPHDPGGGKDHEGFSSQAHSLYPAHADDRPPPPTSTEDHVVADATNSEPIDRWSVALPQHFHQLQMNPEKMERFVDVNRNGIFEQFIKLRKYQTDRLHKQKQQYDHISSMEEQQLHQQQSQQPSSNNGSLSHGSDQSGFPMTSTTQVSPTMSSGSMIGSAAGTSATSSPPSAPAGPLSLVSWVGRPFRGWSSYSFWSSSGAADQQQSQQQQQDNNNRLRETGSDRAPMEAALQRQSGVQILRPIDRSEQQFNDIMISNEQPGLELTQTQNSNSNSPLFPHDHYSHQHHQHQPDQLESSQQQSQQQSTLAGDVVFGSSSVGGSDFGLVSATVPPPATTPISVIGSSFMSTSPSTLLDIYDLNSSNNNHRNQIMQENNHNHHLHHHRHPNHHHQQQQQQQQQHRNRQQQLHQQQSICANCELTADPGLCHIQCASGLISGAPPLVEPTRKTMVATTKPSSLLMSAISNDDQQSSPVTGSFSIGPMGVGTTSPATATMITSSTTTSSSTSLSPGGKMNPFDVTFLLYTRYHRDLVHELVQLNGLKSAGTASIKHGSNLSSASGSSSSAGSTVSMLTGGGGSNSLNPSDSLVNMSDIIDLNNDTTLNESRLNSSLPIKIIIHGFGSGGRRPWVTDMVYKLLDYEDVNVIVVDWEKGAALPNYVQAAGNTRIVGHRIASLIKSINAKHGLTGNRYHLIGFSLGAHVAGFAGMEIRNSTSISRHWINRITGLDPASPLFEGYEINDRLDPSDAQFVDVIHSNGDGVLRGGFGSLQPMGHVDFYPNGGRVQVGCNSVIISALSDIIYGKWQSLCNHRRALNFFMDSFEFSKCRFRSFNCESYESYLRGECFDCGQNNEKCSYMGYLANYSKGRGKMYLTTHEEAPFCANQFIIKIIGSKGYKTHWGKVEVTLVTLDGKNESFWLSSMNSGQSSSPSSSSSSSSSSSTSSSSSSTSTSSPPLSLSSSSSLPQSTSGSSSISSSAHDMGGNGGSSLSQRELNQQSMQSLIVAHPTLVNFTQIHLRYTKYKGWIYSGDENWPIDKVFITDSDGQVKSFCGYNTVLESHITTRLNLEPGNCTVVEQPNSNNNNNGIGTTLSAIGTGANQQSRISLGGGNVVGLAANIKSGSQSSGQAQGVQQQQSSLVGSQQQQQQSTQQTVRTPRLLASIMQSAVGLNDQALPLIHGQSVALQRMMSPQQLVLQTGASGGNVHQLRPHQILVLSSL